MSKSFADLQFPFSKKARKAYDAMLEDAKLRELGVEKIAISETKRELAVQMAYYSRGRMAVDDVKAMYKAAGLYALSTEEAKTPNTGTLESKHLLGLAVDFVPVKNESYWWNAPDAVWERMGEIGEAYGLSWGGRWKSRDCPHFQ